MSKKNKKGIMQEFKEFAMKGNVLDLAIGVVMGTAFSAIVNSLVSDIIMPLISIATGRIDLTNLAIKTKYVLDGVEKELVMPYGKFLQATINFLIISFTIFMMVKLINIASEKLKAKEETEEVKEEKPSKEEVLLTEIRDLLKENKK